MTRSLVAFACVLCLTANALGQTTNNFGSRTGGLGNAGGFATGSGFSNGATGMQNFNARAGYAFSNTGGFPNGSNAGYNTAPSGFNNTGYVSNMAGPMGPALPGLGIGGDALGVGGFPNALTGGIGLGPLGPYGVAPALGVDLPALGPVAAASGLGVPGVGLGIPGVNVGIPGLALPNAANATTTSRNRRPENYTNNAQNVSATSTPSVPVVTPQAQRIQERIARSSSAAHFRNIRVLMAGRTAVLEGSVDSPADEGLVQRLIWLEPGVDGVVSHLVYPGKAQAATASQR
jgi:hypothetical protein